MQVIFKSQELREMLYQRLNDEPTVLPFSVIQPALAQMDDVVMPSELCRRHGFPIGCSIGHAARSMICLLGPDGKEYRLEVLIDFANAEESSEWWRNNLYNPRRVVVEPDEDGFQVMTIASIRPLVAS